MAFKAILSETNLEQELFVEEYQNQVLIFVPLMVYQQLLLDNQVMLHFYITQKIHKVEDIGELTMT